MKHFMYVPFTGLGIYKGFRGDKWLENRIKVFKSMVLPSLIHQTNKNFTLWLSFRPEEEGNPLVMELEATLSQTRNLSHVITYHGICFEDDKYDRPVSTARLQRSLENSLPLLDIGENETVLMTIQPSDDMYLSTMVEDTQELAKKLDTNAPHSIGYMRGYIMNYQTCELAEYQNKTIPPFFTVVFPRSVFVDAEAHMKWTGPYRSHEYIGDHTEYHELEGRGFIVGTHGENTSTTFEPYKGKLIEGEEKERILLQAGIFKAEPIILKKDTRRNREQAFIRRLPKPLRRVWVRLRSDGIGSAINDYSYFNL